MTTHPYAPDPAEWTAILTVWSAFGVILGNILAFVFTWYTIKNRTDLFRRIVASSIVGAIGSVPAMELWLNVPLKPANVVLVFAGLTFAGWPILMAINIAAEKWGPTKK